MQAIASRDFFWPNISQDIRRFVRNCDQCGGAKPWREKKRGLLKPLPIPERIWTEISMDFITDLPPGNLTGGTNCLVITDRLGKGKMYECMKTVTAEAVADRFIRSYVRHHGFPRAIVSDRGTQFISRFWNRLCTKLGIQRRLSTAYQPETDGATERANQELEIYLRMYGTYAQDNWEELLPMAELSSNSKDSSATGISPFFLQHGYDVPIIDTEEPREDRTDSPITRADNILQKLRAAQDWCATAMAVAQERYSRYADQTRQPATALRVGDLVWLNLKNIRTDRPSKKLDWKNAKYRVTEIISPHAVRLNTPPGIHNVFHIGLLRLASSDPLPNQNAGPYEAPGVLQDDGSEEYEVEEVVRARTKRNERQVLVKWKGYRKPTWEPLDALQDTVALQVYEDQYGPASTNDGPQPGRRRRGGVL
jgi:hypothetical protein